MYRLSDVLYSNVENIKGVGKATVRLLNNASLNTVSDVIFTLPYNYIQRNNITGAGELRAGMNIIAQVTILEHQTYNKVIKIITDCYGETLELVFFNNMNNKIRYVLPAGSKKVISGTVSKYGFHWQITHPEIVRDQISRYEPVYHAVSGLTSNMFRRLTAEILSMLEPAEEWNELARQYDWPSFTESLRILHNPTSDDDMKKIDKCKERLACDELLARRISIRKMRELKRHAQGKSIAGDGRLSEIVYQRLGFDLTQDQKNAIKDIIDDQAQPTRMFRMLLGDVGSGKTLVALFAMLNAVESGAQAVLLVPTEMLAHQHYRKINALLEGLGVTTALMAGKTKKRRELERKIKSGEINILIGAHALFQERTRYADLGLVVIDEQHRFGVEHRAYMANKGEGADVLFMSATPIPRSMIMLKYDYLDHSVLTEKPSVRGKITTVMIPLGRIGEIIDRIVASNSTKPFKLYWICPLIDESETLDLMSVTERFTMLRGIFGDKVGIAHRRVPIEEREQTIADFLEGKISVLIATTVVEVGIDVPDANAIIIENPNRFGLSQLHQLRGRVARGIESGSCILLYPDDADSNTLQRLRVLCNNDDGFVIAEHDLKIRGGGNLVGYRQSGHWDYKFFSPDKHDRLLDAVKSHTTEKAEILCKIFNNAVAEDCFG